MSNTLGDQYRTELIKIESRVRGNYTYWMLSYGDRQRDLGFLKERVNSDSYPSLRPIAQELLDFITDHELFISQLKTGDRVIVIQGFGECKKGMTGTYFGEGNPNDSFIKIDGDTHPAGRRIITRLLFPVPQKEETKPASTIPWVTSLVDQPEASSDSASTELDTHQLVREMLLEPCPTTKKEIPMGRPKGSYGKARREREAAKKQQAVSVLVVADQKMKRGRKPGTKNKPKQVIQEVSQEEPIVEAKVIQSPAEVEQPSAPETIVEKPANIEVVETAEPASEPSRAIMLYQDNHPEEIFLIRDQCVFVPGFLFAKNVNGKRQIHVVTQTMQRGSEKRMRLVCSWLGDSGETWIPAVVISFEPPKLFMKEEDKFFYLTPTEYQRVYMTSCLVDLPVTIGSVEEVLAMHSLFQDRIVSLLEMYAIQHQGFSVKDEVLAVYAKLAKHNQLDFRRFASIIQIVFSDNPSEVENILQQFKKFLGQDVLERQPIQEILSKTTNRIRSQELAAQMKARMYRMTDHLELLSEAQLQQLEELLQNVGTPEEPS